MTTEELFLEVLKWIGGGGVALLGVYLTGKRDTTNKNMGIINDLQKENIRKDERLDKQDEKIQMLIDQVDEMRAEMFSIQTEKHKSEVKNIELQSKNARLEKQRDSVLIQIDSVKKEKAEIRKELENKMSEMEIDLNRRIDKLVARNNELRNKISGKKDKK